MTGHMRVAASTAQGTNGIQYRYRRFGNEPRFPLLYALFPRLCLMHSLRRPRPQRHGDRRPR